MGTNCFVMETCATLASLDNKDSAQAPERGCPRHSTLHCKMASCSLGAVKASQLLRLGQPRSARASLERPLPGRRAGTASPTAARYSLLSLLLLLGLSAGSARLSARESKKLIEFGWDEPDTSLLRSNLQQMAQSPFDGCVFHADFRKTNGTTGSFTWQAWGQETFSEADLASAFADLKAIRPGRFRFNFLRFNTTPAKLDWFDDYSAVISNARLAARLARAGKCPGILFDIEQYEAPLFDYRKQRDAESKSWESYATQARLRGGEVMRAFQENYPGLTVFLTFGYCLPWSETGGGKKSLADCKYGLLAPFLDGMIQSANPKVRLIDGYELSYGYKSAAEFESAHKKVKEDLLPIVRQPDKYLRTMSLAFGIWMDRDWRKRGWNPQDFSNNFFSPEALTASAKAALKVSDEFVWIYSESPRWWAPAGSTNAVPRGYAEAIRQARQP